jgi:hypothetical protein
LTVSAKAHKFRAVTKLGGNGAMKTAAVSLIASLALFCALAATADARVLKRYCSPSGDYCTAVTKSKGRYFLGIATFSFSGKYRLCARHTDSGRKICKSFRLRGSGGNYRSSRNFGADFNPPPNSRYCVTWRKSGSRLGKPLCFNYRP